MKITIYSTVFCAECKTLEQWLKKNNINYEKKVTDQDPSAMMEFMSLNDGMIAVPFSVITDDEGNQTKISGYNREKFQQALGI